jgi:hypothetical protein
MIYIVVKTLYLIGVKSLVPNVVLTQLRYVDVALPEAAPRRLMEYSNDKTGVSRALLL